jgi:hypothetical protein
MTEALVRARTFHAKGGRRWLPGEARPEVSAGPGCDDGSAGEELTRRWRSGASCVALATRHSATLPGRRSGYGCGAGAGQDSEADRRIQQGGLRAGV